MGFLNALPGIFAAVILFLIFWVIATVLRKTMRLKAKKAKFDVNTAKLFSRLTYYGVLIVGVVTVFAAGGVDLASIFEYYERSEQGNPPCHPGRLVKRCMNMWLSGHWVSVTFQLSFTT